MIKELLKQWTDFSSSETKPLFWMLLGPISIILTLALLPSSVLDPLLPLVAVSGLVLSWRYRSKGLVYTLAGMALYLMFYYLLGESAIFLWKFGYVFSLTLGLFISFHAMEEVKSFYSSQKKVGDKDITDLQIALNQAEEKSILERGEFEKEIEELKLERHSLKQESEALLKLVEASRIESEKNFKRGEMLSGESLEQHRQIEALKQDLSSYEEMTSTLQSSQKSLAKAAKERLKDLNAKRVECYQSSLLIEGYEKQIKRAREYFLSQKKGNNIPAKKESSSTSLVETLQTLELNKGEIKKSYTKMQKELSTLKKQKEEGSLKLKKAPDATLQSEMEKLDVQMSEKKAKIDRTKAELTSIEREIFVIKKGLQEKGAFATH